MGLKDNRICKTTVQGRYLLSDDWGILFAFTSHGLYCLLSCLRVFFLNRKCAFLGMFKFTGSSSLNISNVLIYSLFVGCYLTWWTSIEFVEDCMGKAMLYSVNP